MCACTILVSNSITHPHNAAWDQCLFMGQYQYPSPHLTPYLHPLPYIPYLQGWEPHSSFSFRYGVQLSDQRWDVSRMHWSGRLILSYYHSTVLMVMFLDIPFSWHGWSSILRRTRAWGSSRFAKNKVSAWQRCTMEWRTHAVSSLIYPQDVWFTPEFEAQRCRKIRYCDFVSKLWCQWLGIGSLVKRNGKWSVQLDIRARIATQVGSYSLDYQQSDNVHFFNHSNIEPVSKSQQTGYMHRRNSHHCQKVLPF